MPLREDLLTPIPGPNPCGVDLRYDPVYEKIKEARRQDDNLPQGEWKGERKLADYITVAKLAQDALAGKSKDLQLAAWLTEALLKRESFGGFGDGLALCKSLIENFWDNLYPELEDGDGELRSMPLAWMASRLDDAVRHAPLNNAGHSWYRHKESRGVPTEEQAKSDNDKKKSRDKLIKEGKLAPEDFEKSFHDTPKAFYAKSGKDLDSALEASKALEALCDEKFGGYSPGFGKLRTALEEVRRLVHQLLDKKRETDPDPVEEAAPALAEVREQAESGAAAAPEIPNGVPAPVVAAGLMVSVHTSSEPADRKEAVASVAAAAAVLRRRDPLSPAPYLMLRGLRWGELRAAAALSDATMLEAPPTEVRQHLKKLALGRKWNDLLEAAESVMALPCSRAWLDLQRLVVEACAGLGGHYDAIAIAIRSELKALLRDLPQLLDVALMDDTPTANAETRAWIRELLQEPADAIPAGTGAAAGGALASSNGHTAGWQRKFIDSYALATEALRTGEEQKAFEILRTEIERQRSGRGRFQRRLQLVQLCVATGKDAIAQPILEDLIAAIENHKLDDWEDREVVAGALALIMKASKRIQGDAKEKQKLFERICRLDPVQALSC